MTICWDNLERLKYSPDKKCWYGNNGVTRYVYKESCENCGEPFLAQANASSRFCCISCGLENNRNGAKKNNKKTNYYDPIRMQQRRKEYRKGWIKILEQKIELKCCQCNESDFCCLDFHHKDPSKKEFTISRYMTGKPTLKKVAKLWLELENCLVLCANCHRRIHFKK